jgi:hypothetical protein
MLMSIPEYDATRSLMLVIDSDSESFRTKFSDKIVVVNIGVDNDYAIINLNRTNGGVIQFICDKTCIPELKDFVLPDNMSQQLATLSVQTEDTGSVIIAVWIVNVGRKAFHLKFIPLEI